MFSLVTGRVQPYWEPLRETEEFSLRRIKSDGRYRRTTLFAWWGNATAGNRCRPLAAGDHFFKMRGNELFKVAVRFDD